MDASEQLARALTAVRRGHLDEARALCREVLSAQPENHAARYLLGGIAAQAGRFEEACEHFQQAVEQCPDQTAYLLNLGNVYRILGRLDDAARAFSTVLERDPDDAAAARGLAFSTLPGDNYEILLRRFHEWLKPAVYLEIGVETGRTLALARPPTRAFGVDPEPKIAVSFTAETEVFSVTSDEFFASEAIEKVGTIDLGFLDGLHLFEQTLRDFINMERHAAPGSVICVHDCLPLNRQTARREQSSAFWTGDPWKLIPALRRHRPDLETFVVASAPTGLGVITRLDPASRTLEERWDDIVAEYVPMELPEEPAEKKEQLAVVENDWAEIRERLEQA